MRCKHAKRATNSLKMWCEINTVFYSTPPKTPAAMVLRARPEILGDTGSGKLAFPSAQDSPSFSAHAPTPFHLNLDLRVSLLSNFSRSRRALLSLDSNSLASRPSCAHFQLGCELQAFDTTNPLRAIAHYPYDCCVSVCDTKS